MEKILRDNFRTLRMKINVTQKEMANYLGLAQSSISKFESGKQNLTLSHLEKACALFGIRLQDLYQKREILPALCPSFRKSEVTLSLLEDVANINKIAMNILEMNEILGEKNK